VSGVANHYKFVLTARWIPEKSDTGQQFMSLRYWVTQDLGVGFDYRPLIDQLKFNATYRLVSEDPRGWRPAILLGTSFDDFTSKGVQTESRSYFATVSKAMPRLKFLNITPSPYMGAAWIDRINEIRPLTGINFIHKEASLMLQYSGTDTHLSLSRKISDNLSLSAIYWGMKYPGAALRFRF
jgi:hypothetical protein